MTSDPASRLFDFATSNREPETEDEHMVTELHAALGLEHVPSQLRLAPVSPPRPNWRHYFPVAAAVVLVIALLGASFSTLVPGSRPNDHFASIPPVVLGLVGQNSATPTAASCDLNSDIPFFSGIAESPIDGPAILLTPEEELVLNCGIDQTVLLTGVKVAGPTMTPHVVIAITENADHLLNIESGKHIQIPNGGPQAQTSISQQMFGPWVLSASTSDMTRASFYNLTTLTEIPITDENGDPVTIASLDAAVISSRQDKIAITIPDDPESINSILSGYFITNLDDESRFVTVEEMPMPRQIAISPDGQTIASSSFDGSVFGGTTTITLLGTEDGEVIQTHEMKTRDQASEITWMRDSETLLLTNGTMFLGITPDSPKEGIRVFATGENMQGILLTPDDQVVVISESSTSVNSRSANQTLFVNVDTNAIVTQPGSDMWSNPNISATRTTLVLAQASEVRAGDTPNLLVVDTVTGEVIGEIDQDRSIDSSFQSSTWGYGDGEIVTVAFGPDSMWLLVDAGGNATLEKIAPPPLDDADYQAVSLVISPDGFMSLRTFEPYSAWFKAPDTDEWIRIDLSDPDLDHPIESNIRFVLGD